MLPSTQYSHPARVAVFGSRAIPRHQTGSDDAVPAEVHVVDEFVEESQYLVVPLQISYFWSSARVRGFQWTFAHRAPVTVSQMSFPRAQ